MCINYAQPLCAHCDNFFLMLLNVSFLASLVLIKHTNSTILIYNLFSIPMTSHSINNNFIFKIFLTLHVFLLPSFISTPDSFDPSSLLIITSIYLSSSSHYYSLSSSSHYYSVCLSPQLHIPHLIYGAHFVFTCCTSFRYCLSFIYFFSHIFISLPHILLI